MERRSSSSSLARSRTLCVDARSSERRETSVDSEGRVRRGKSVRRGEAGVAELVGNEGGDVDVEAMGAESEDEITMTSWPGSIVRLLILSSTGTGPTVVMCWGMGARGTGTELPPCMRIKEASDTRLLNVLSPSKAPCNRVADRLSWR